MCCKAKNGKIRSFKRSAPVMGVLVAYSLTVRAIFQIRFSATDRKQSFYPTRVTGGLIAVKGIPGKAHDAAGR